MAIETTLGADDAESYATVDDLETYAAGFGTRYALVNDSATSEVTKEAALRLAAIFVDGRGRDKRNDLARWWPGTRVSGSQALVWPRNGATFTDGTVIADGTLPVQIKRAVMNAAAYEVQNPGTLDDLIIASQSVKKEKVGDLEIEYIGKIDDFEKLRPAISLVEDYIAQIIRMPEVSAGAGGGSGGTSTSANFNFLSVGS